MKSISQIQKAENIFKKHGGMLRTSDAIRAGIHPAILYAMRNSGLLVQISRGVYRLADSSAFSNPDLITVVTRIPNGVICLTTALSIHEITTQVPHVVHVALPKGSEEPRLDYPPVQVYRFSGKSFTEGIEIITIDGIQIQIFNIEKTLADCFKFRNKIGFDSAIEALRLYHERGRLKVDDVIRYASICRVEKIMRPYLEAIF